MKNALIVYGGWDGHEPEQIAQLCKDILREAGLATEVADDLAVLTARDLNELSLFVPIWTMGEISQHQVQAVCKAVENGMGIGGCHGGMCDAFRNSAEWQFLTGGQWVAHPGDDGLEYEVKITNRKHPITEGLSDFKVRSEQYYMHVDPSNNVLATTRFPIAPGPHTPNGPFDMPVVWTRLYGKGKVFYSSLGHHRDVIDHGEPLEILTRGLLWAAR